MSKLTEREITRELANFVVSLDYAELPKGVVAAAKQAMVDYVAVALAGSVEPPGKLITSFVRRMECAPHAAVIAAGFRTSACNAALANGTMAHALDYDDVGTNSGGYPIGTHLTTPIMSAALALGEELNTSGQQLITAYVAGFEVASQLANAMGQDFGDALGWHPTAPLATVGAAAAAAKLLRLDATRTAIAIGLAASQAAGLRQNFGTMTKAFHIGNAARSGVISALLSRDGFTAATDALEGSAGFCHAFSGGRGYDFSQIAEDPKRSFQLLSGAPTVKLYPCCASAHGALNALFSLIEKHKIQADKVSSIDVTVPFDPPRSLIHDNPQTDLEGRFSLQYCLGAAIVDGKIGLESFTTERVMRPQVRKLFDRIKMFRRPEMRGRPSWEEGDYIVTVKMVNGENYSEKARAPMVAPIENPTPAQLTMKYRDCAGLVLSASQVTASLELLQGMEKVKDITALSDIVVQTKG